MYYKDFMTCFPLVIKLDDVFVCNQLIGCCYLSENDKIKLS
jgi:hypothetical protein